MERAWLPEADHHDYYLAVDEFQNYATDSIADTRSVNDGCLSSGPRTA